MINHAPPAARPAVPAAGTLIAVAPTGAQTAKADCPQLPTTLDELVETATACQAAGASLIHVRDADHRPSLDPVLLRESVQAVREQTSMVIQLSTGGSVDDPLEKRLTVMDGEPDSASLPCGTTNFGDDVFLNPHPFIAQLYQLAHQRDGIGGLGAPLTPLDPRAWVHQVTEQSAATRGLNPPLEPAHADIVDPFGREEEVFATMTPQATMTRQIVQSLPAVVRTVGR
jgi:beta-keto acid cleavage enzyme